MPGVVPVGRALDRLVEGTIVLIIVLTPLAIGSVAWWAFGPAEAAVFCLIVVWMAKLLWLRRRGQKCRAGYGLRTLALPALALVGFVLLQWLPLPAAILRLAAPSTYELYSKSLPGWPDKLEYDDPSFADTADSVNAAVHPLKAAKAERSSFEPLSLAPSLGHVSALKLTTYISLFFLIAFYPLSDDTGVVEERFSRTILLAVLGSGALVATIGVLQTALWNGKILWFYVPHDWSGPLTSFVPRASGPFVNPDHFADYLAMILPLTVSAALFGVPLRRPGSFGGFQILCGASAVIAISAIVLSLSRAAWAGVLVGLAFFAGSLWFGRHKTEAAIDTPHVFGGSRRSARAPVSAAPPLLRTAAIVAVFSSLLVGVLLLIGARGRTQADARVEQTLAGGIDMLGRWGIWKDGVKMVRDFPLFGVGLGSWPEIFPRYQSPPWSPYLFVREAHNDYLEVVSELGVIGAAFAVFLFCRLARKLAEGARAMPLQQLVVFAAIAAGVVTVAFHEIFDFSLQMPANALLFVVLLGLAFRMARGAVGEWQLVPASSRSSAILEPVVAAAALLLALTCLGPQTLRYPRDIAVPNTMRRAEGLVLSHPASAAPHLSLARFLGTEPTPALLRELTAAVWLYPTDPFARDHYAGELALAGRTQEALEQIKSSIVAAPRLADHSYLVPQLITRLSPSEQEAIEQGFKLAIDRRYPDSVEGLAQFYSELDRHSDEASVYALAAKAVGPSAGGLYLYYLIAAGEAFVRAGDTNDAEHAFHQASREAPSYLRPYQDLLALVYGPAKDVKSSALAVHDAIENGADPVVLYLALARVARASGDSRQAEAALTKVVEYEPSVDNLLELGSFYLDEGSFDKAALVIRRATETDPGSASAVFHLAMAEEGAYQYSAAERDYAQAMALAPDDASIRARRDELGKKIRGGRSAESAGNAEVN